LLLYRFDAPLFFANASFFADDLSRRIAERADSDPVECVIVTAEPITDLDVTAADMLRELFENLSGRDIAVKFAELKGAVHDRFDRYQVFPGDHPEHTARTVGEAVKAYIREYGVAWIDWEDRPT
jgi:MFS superfamily sulfate permease-like transporter